ncbi:permease for cytosine/purines, uracil, thiamine, allantoin-domain-containing protein [Microdochium trichocladiopsis]|uniref:Permease for cytosine/purines, uracil, thiamine, allantoin-domain-containing protein n=1 Tax=Microdochium trichocladiopsis TaxID=1682393 RepID=A0A9P9BPC5_9PEZI|nr:permease for cytosine/purines, uracil, thiamine, allantoin-domain-containing protein [Microdochium trichocladiopsis]KAH7028930.1 permease for cytosine/purines, uracil, thiamine, allantoin-domain-containing protein [Microdochium trichocladiopsis]
MDSIREVPARLARRCTSLSSWKLPKPTSTLAPAHVWSNADMDPVPPEKQTWDAWTWMGYWASDAINIGTWQAASSILAVGLSWRDAIAVVFVGTTCIAVPMVLNGAVGARLHVPFSVAVRAGFGYYLAYYCIVSRAVLAASWLGIQSVSGSQCVTIMLAAIWPSYRDIANTLPTSAGIDTKGMLSYCLFWLIQIPLLLVPPRKLKWLFVAKMIVAPITAFAMLGWERLLPRIAPGSGGRAAAFFAAAAWFIVQVGSNVTANCISAANDLTVLMPRYVNIRRGCIITAVAGGWVFVPWKILASAGSFLSFMGGYAVFLGPIAGVLVSDYWLVRRQKVDVPGMYDPDGRYRYWYGINWRALVTLLACSVPNLPGLAASISPASVSISEGAQNLYSFNWMFGFTAAVFAYWGMSLVFPPWETFVGAPILGVAEAAEAGERDSEAGVTEAKGDVAMGKLAEGPAEKTRAADEV